MSEWTLRLFGECELLRAGQPTATFRYDKVRGLLAYLALNAGSALRREALAALLWPELDGEQARNNLRNAVFELRRPLGAAADRLLEVTRHTLLFRTEALGVFDHAEFLADTVATPTEMESRLQLYRGEFLAGLSFDDAPMLDVWLKAHREQAARHALQLHEQLAQHHEAAQRLDDALRHVRRITTLAPWQESERRRLMRLLVAVGQPAAALHEFDACCRYLQDELGVEPDPETLDLARALREQQPATQAPANAQRRRQRQPVTALAFQLRLPEGDDLESAAEACAEPLARIAGLATQRGAHCLPLPGGVLMAYFGYPAAREQMPRRAAAAALEIMAELAHYPALAASIGLHAGWMLGDSQLGVPDIAGAVTQRALALATQGADRVIAVSPELGTLLGASFQCAATSPDCLQLLGKLLPTDVVPATLTPLVGRRDELHHLLVLWEEACRGQNTSALIQGEPGIGKTRLLAALVHAVVLRGGQVRALRCDADEMQIAYAPIAAWLSRQYGLVEMTDPAVALATLETAMTLAGDADCLPAAAAVLRLPSALDRLTDAATRKQQIEEALLALLRRGPSGSAALLTLEDVHWADPATLALLERMLRWQAPASSTRLLVLTSRTAISCVTDCNIQLKRLSATQSAELVRRIGERIPVAAKHLSTIIARADGIPLFIEQMMRSVADPAVNHHVAGLAVADIPPTLRDLLAARLHALGDDLFVAQCAAVIGREFDTALLIQLSGQPASTIAAALAHMEQSGLLAVLDDGHHRFSHALIGEAALHSLAQQERRSLHLRLARLYLALMPEWVTAHPETVARHLDLAQDTEAAAAWLGAGQYMAARAAPAEALAHFQSGLAALEHLSDPQHRADTEFRLQIAIGNALVAQQGYGSEAAKAAFVRAQALGGSLSNDADLFQLMWGLWLGGRSTTGELPPLAFLEKLAAVAAGATDPAIQLQLHYAYGNNYFWIGKPALARQHLEAAIALIPQVDGAALAAQYGEDGGITSRTMLSWVLWVEGELAAAQAMSAAALVAARAAGHAQSLGFALTGAALLHRFLGLPAQVKEICEELIVFSQANGMLLWQAAGAAMLGWARAVGGDAGGLDLIRAGLAGAQQAMLIVETTFLAFLAESLCRLGRLDEALAVVEESIAKAQVREDVYYLAEFLRLKGEIRLRLNPDLALAEHCFGEGLALAREQGARMLELRCAMSLAALREQQERRDEACQVLAPVCATFAGETEFPDIQAAQLLRASLVR